MRLGLAAFAASAWLLLSACPAAAQGNHVVLRDFDWKLVSTQHFDIYYYEDSKALVPFSAEVLERSYARLSRQLNATWDKRKPFFLYANQNDMQQSNIVEVGDGTGGVTEAFKDRFMVFNDGSRQWLDTVATHELTHVFQYQVLVSGFWKSARILKTIVYPLWMMEGMAEFGSWQTDDTAGQVIVRDAATSGGLIPVWKLEHFSHLKPHQVRLAYESGEEILEFLEGQFGPGKVSAMLHMFESRFESSAVLSELIGMDIFAFDKKWREFTTEKYKRVVRLERLQEPEAYGEPLTGKPGDIPEFNSSPVFTPDGGRMAYLSTRDGHPPSLMIRDLKKGKTRRLVEGVPRIENVHLGNFANISRVLSISPDGRWIAFAGTKNHRDSIYMYDLERKRVKKVPVPGMMMVMGTAFSPDGKSLAFSGMAEGFTDIYVVDLETHNVRRLTQDRADDQTPAFSPDGRSVVYSSEVEVPGDAMFYQRRLYRVDVETLVTERLSEIRGAARDPVFSPDGKRVLFVLEADGAYDLHELELPGGRVTRLTRSVGAAYTPLYTPSGKIAFAAFRKGSIHVHEGDRARFLSEEAAAGRRLVPPLETGEPAVAASTGAARMTAARPYKPQYSTDLFIPAFFYSSNAGFFWTSYWQGSDLLGNHQAQGLVTYASGEGYVNYQGFYGYNRYRPQIGVGVSGLVSQGNYDRDANLSYDQSYHQEYLSASYPLDRFHRIDTAFGSTSEHRYEDTGERVIREARPAQIAFVRDTVRGRYLVANQGSQLSLAYRNSPDILGSNFIYQTYYGEGIKYFRLGDLSALVVRGLGVETTGPGDTPRYQLGGIGGVRGYARSADVDEGPRMTLATAELRFPVMGNLNYYMWYIFPDFYFKAITAAIFTDAGYTWYSRDQIADATWNSIRHSYGVGLRLHTFILQLFPLVIHFDYARRTTSNGGVFYVYLGPLF